MYSYLLKFLIRFSHCIFGVSFVQFAKVNPFLCIIQIFDFFSFVISAIKVSLQLEKYHNLYTTCRILFILHVHTYYSILDGQASVQKLVDKAIANGMGGWRLPIMET